MFRETSLQNMKIKFSIIPQYIYYYTYIVFLLIIANPKGLTAELKTSPNREKSGGWAKN